MNEQFCPNLGLLHEINKSILFKNYLKEQLITPDLICGRNKYCITCTIAKARKSKLESTEKDVMEKEEEKQGRGLEQEIRFLLRRVVIPLFLSFFYSSPFTSPFRLRSPVLLNTLIETRTCLPVFISFFLIYILPSPSCTLSTVMQK